MLRRSTSPSRTAGLAMLLVGAILIVGSCAPPPAETGGGTQSAATSRATGHWLLELEVRNDGIEIARVLSKDRPLRRRRAQLPKPWRVLVHDEAGALVHAARVDDPTLLRVPPGPTDAPTIVRRDGPTLLVVRIPLLERATVTIEDSRAAGDSRRVGRVNFDAATLRASGKIK